MFNLKSFPTIVSDILNKILAETPITDIRPGSVILTLAEAVANEDAQQYAAMLNLIENYNLDTTTGDDLTERAMEFGLERLTSGESSGYVSFENTAITKRQSVLYAASPSPAEGAVTLDVERNSDTDLFPSSGYVWVGRGTLNTEKVQYTSIDVYADYITLHLSLGTLCAHGTESTIILSQAGSEQTIPIGTEVYVPATDISPKITFITKETAIILDGESTVTDVLVNCTSAGSVGNVPIDAISGITSPPIATLTVYNDTSFVNGSDIESDQELRDRIRQTIQSLSKGTRSAIQSRIAGASSEEDHKSVVSSSYVEATELGNPSYIYIDDGTGFEPSWSGQGYEEVVGEAAGTERFLSLDAFPIMKASVVSNNSEPYSLSSGQTLTIYVGNETETISILSTGFKNIAAATAEEVAAFINDYSTLVEARTTDTGSKVILSPISVTNDYIKITGGTANTALGFPVGQYFYTLNLYKNDVLLSKDGSVAFVETECPPTVHPRFQLADGQTLVYNVDGKPQTLTITFSSGDFADITNATADEIADVINTKGVGVTAVVTSDEEVKIMCIGEPSSSSELVISAAGTANAALWPGGTAFPITATGTDRDYILNRYNGQIELTDALIAADMVTAGSSNTRAYVRCTSPEMYSLAGGDSIDIAIDGGAAVTWTSTLGPGSFTAAEIADDINAAIVGATAFIKTINEEDYLCIRTNTQDYASGSIAIDSTLAPALDFISSTISNQNPSMGYSASSHDPSIPLTIGRNQNLIIILDSDTLNRVWNLSLQSSGTVTTHVGSSVTHFASAGAGNLSESYTIDDVFVDAEIQFDSTTLTAALQNEKAIIASYSAATGEITLTAGTALPAIPSAGDTFKIYPRTSKNVVDLLNNPAFTSLSGFCSVEVSNASTIGTTDKIQITTSTYGAEGAVQISGGTANGFSIPFLSNGTAIGTFTVGTTTGLSEGLEVIIDDSVHADVDTVYIKSISGATSPYTIAMMNITPPDISAYKVADAATIVGPAILFTADGTASGTFEVGDITGLSLGLPIQIDSGTQPAFDCYIKHIEGSVAPYTITVETAPDLHDYEVLSSALIKDKNGLSFSTTNFSGIDAYKYYTGLTREVQWQIDGLDSDPINYPGYKAAGTHIEVKSPVIRLIDFEIDLTTSPGVSINDVANDVRSAITSYVNRAGVGADIILSEVVAAVHQINFVDDIVIISPTSNVVIQDTELPRTNEVLITLG